MSQASDILDNLDISTHEHTVSDTDKSFTVDPFTRQIIADSGQKTVLIQGDHNSEVFTITIPRYIEGHDMAACNKIYIPYLNTEATKKDPSFKSGVYTVSNITVNEDTIVLVWKLSINATSLEGTLSFMILLSCMEGSRVEYRWNTDYYEDVLVKKSLYSNIEFETEYLDVIEQWKETVKTVFKEYIDSEVDSHIATVKAELEASMKADFEAYSEEVEGKLETFNDILETETTNMSNKQAVLEARMDTFTSLQEGSTTGDAELADIRVDFEGTTHNAAGDATRNTATVLDNVKQRAYGSFESVEGTVHTDVVYNVDSKVEQSISGGYYAEYTIDDEIMLLVSGFSWSSYSIFPLGAFYDAEGNLLKKFGHTSSTTFDKMLVYVPVGATSLIVNGKSWYEPEVEKFVSGDLETDISEIQKILDSQIISSKLKSYEELGVETITITLSEDNTELLEEQMYTSEGNLTTGILTDSTYDTLYYPVGTFSSFLLSKYTSGVYGGAFLDENKNWISSFKTDYPNNLEEKVVPENAYYIAITVVSTNRYRTIIGYRKTYELSGLKVNAANVLGPWTGKKIVWIGTSVPFGQYATTSYPYEAAKHLGFELINCSVPGLAIHTGDNNATLKYGSLSLSTVEYEALGWTIPDTPVEYTPGGSYNDYYRAYDNVFCEENADADLYVFDVVPNNSNFDTSDWDLFDFGNWCYTDGTDFSEHRTTFLGALLFLMDKMYELNENARMVFILGSGFSYGNGKTALEVVKGKWNIPIIDVWSKINISPKSINKIFSEDGTNGHPSTFAHELMGKMLAHDLKGVC